MKNLLLIFSTYCEVSYEIPRDEERHQLAYDTQI